MYACRFARRKVRDVWAKVCGSSDGIERLASVVETTTDRDKFTSFPKIIP